MEIFVFLVNITQEQPQQKSTFKIRQKKMTHSIDIRHHFSSDIPVLDKWAFAQSGHVVRDRGYAWT